MSSAEIILEKLAATLVLVVTTVFAGIPLMLILHLLGGIDFRVLLLAYAGLATTVFFLASLAIAVSTSAPSARLAMNSSVLWMMSWFVLPVVIPMALPRLGIHLPSWLATVNAWLIASSPLGVGMKLAMGVGASSGLLFSIAWMCGLQLSGAVLLLAGSIVRLRSAYRANVSGEIHAWNRAQSRLVKRFWRRPEVGDDPILWREKYTSRDNRFARIIGVLINLSVLAGLTYGVYYYARPALREVWNHGYRSGGTTQTRPEFNLFIRIFMTGDGIHDPVNVARFEFNLFLRCVTVPIAFILATMAAGTATEVISRERAKETWTSLLATPMIARDILRGVLCSTIWKVRELIAIVVIMWTVGLIAGAIHPLGYLVSLLVLASSTWCFAASGILCSVYQAKESPPAKGKGLRVASILLWMGFLPFMVQIRMNSILVGSGSSPFVLWLSLASYRDINAALDGPTFTPLLQWMGIGTGEGRLQVIACCLIGIVGSALLGRWNWRYAVSHFDRFVGRPWNAGSAVQDRPGSPAIITVETEHPSQCPAMPLATVASAGGSN